MGKLKLALRRPIAALWLLADCLLSRLPCAAAGCKGNGDWARRQGPCPRSLHQGANHCFTHRARQHLWHGGFVHASGFVAF